MPLLRRPSGPMNHLNDQVSSEFVGVVEETITFHPLPPTHVPTTSDRFVVAKSNILFRLASSGMNDFNHMKKTNQPPLRVFPFTKAT